MDNINDERFGLTEIRAFGTYSFKISDAGKFNNLMLWYEW